MMTLDEAIRHAKETAKDQEEHAYGKALEKECLECAAEHRQLAEWLEELKMYRETAGRYIILRDNKIEGSTADRESAIEMIRMKQEHEKKTHQWLHAEFSIIRGEQEFIKYE